nr:MAG TPA: Single strand binding protein [Caudoviricetes sp.]
MNKIILIGNLTKDPELSETSSGVKFCKFGIAVNRPFANSDGEREVDFFNITTWRGQAETCAKYIIKGKKVCIVGSLQNREYTDNNGVKRTATDVIASEIEFLSARSEDGERPAKKAGERPQLEEYDDEELPF